MFGHESAQQEVADRIDTLNNRAAHCREEAEKLKHQREAALKNAERCERIASEYAAMLPTP